MKRATQVIVIFLCCSVGKIYGTTICRPSNDIPSFNSASHIYNDEVRKRQMIQIDNQTKNKYYFWVNPTPIRQIAPEFLIRCYFWSIPEGYDFAFGHLITEPNIEFGDYEIKLGYNFIKLLSPGESFRLIINDDEARDDYKNRLVIISEKEFQKYFDTIPDFFLYKDDHIIIR